MTDRTHLPILAAALAAFLLAGYAAFDRSPAGVDASQAAQERAFTRTIDAPELEWGPCPDFMPESCRLTVLQGDPEQPGADAFFKLIPGTTAPEHWHTSAERMVLVSGRMEVDYEGQEPVELTPGTYAYGPAELPHATHCLDGDNADDCVLFIAFEEPVDALEVQ